MKCYSHILQLPDAAMKHTYRKTFKRTVKNGTIIYAGMTYTAPELKNLEGKKVEVTKFGSEPGCFDIAKLLVNPTPYKEGSLFWVE